MPSWRVAPGLRLAVWPGESSALAFDPHNGRTHLISAQALELLEALQTGADADRVAAHTCEEVLAGLLQARLLVASPAD